MNKQALKLKQKRRKEKESIKNEKLNKMWDELNQYNIESGKPALKKSKEQMLNVYKATKQVDAKVHTKTGVIALVCSLIILYKYYERNIDELLKYSNQLRKFILFMGKNNYSMTMIMEEIEKDYNVPIIQLCKSLPRLSMNEYNKYNMEDTIIKSTVDNFPYFIGMNAHVFMNYLAFDFGICWNHKDLNLFITKSISLYKKILQDSLYLKTLNDILINECDICVNLTNGNVNTVIKK